jgi:multidrug transporter EmrE-like cation transporter
MKWLLLLAGILSNASASVLVKMALAPNQPIFSIAEPLAIFKNLPLWCGVAFYGIAFVLYALALLHLPLNVAHPLLTSGAIATVALCSVFIFGEPFYWTTAMGIALILAGVWLITQRTA